MQWDGRGTGSEALILHIHFNNYTVLRRFSTLHIIIIASYVYIYIYLRAYARQPARGVEVWRVEDWVRVQAEGVDVGRLGGLGPMLRTAWV